MCYRATQRLAEQQLEVGSEWLREAFHHGRSKYSYSYSYSIRQESQADAKVSARQPWYIGRNSLNRPSF